MLHRKIGAGQRDLNEAAHLFKLFFFDPVERVKTLHFAGDLAVEVGGVEVRNWSDAADARDEVLPALLRADAQRADQPNSRNHNPLCHGFSAPVRVSGYIWQTPHSKKLRACRRKP